MPPASPAPILQALAPFTTRNRHRLAKGKICCSLGNIPAEKLVAIALPCWLVFCFFFLTTYILWVFIYSEAPTLLAAVRIFFFALCFFFFFQKQSCLETFCNWKFSMLAKRWSLKQCAKAVNSVTLKRQEKNVAVRISIVAVCWYRNKVNWVRCSRSALASQLLWPICSRLQEFHGTKHGCFIYVLRFRFLFYTALPLGTPKEMVYK